MKKWNTEPFLGLAAALSDGEFEGAARLAGVENRWFTPENVAAAAAAIREDMLAPAKLREWLSAYEKPEGFRPRRVGVVMAGNIPMVGFADLLAVLVAGHSATVKLSSKDSALMGYVVDYLTGQGCDVEAADSIDRYDVDAVIVTGSDATRDKFREEFEGILSILRGDRYSAAVLTGAESPEQIAALASDMFMYWGMGCRSVSLLYLPEGYDPNGLASALGLSAPEFVNEDFAECYRYSRAVEAMNGREFCDGGFFVLRPYAAGRQTPLATADYIYYSSPEQLNGMIAAEQYRLQCVVAEGMEGLRFGRICGFGMAQRPTLSNYADGVDTMRFLLGL